MKKIIFLISCVWLLFGQLAVAQEPKIVHEPIFPTSYTNGKPPVFEHERGQQLGYEPNTLRLKDHVFTFSDLSGNTGKNNDFTRLMEEIDKNVVVKVGQKGLNTFFGHYYDLSGTGVFNPIVDEQLIEIGSPIIVTDNDGYSKGYQVTQILEVLNAEQDQHYYGKEHLPVFVYEGNGMDMVYVQYCRWDISYGLLIGNIAYRVW
ncbi:MAG: hypothetical protein Q4B80_06170 [Aerococcaceae bacterium]|nr:hypothetical protein [Aerococcaceae bacterium]